MTKWADLVKKYKEKLKYFKKQQTSGEISRRYTRNNKHQWVFIITEGEKSDKFENKSKPNFIKGS